MVDEGPGGHPPPPEPRCAICGKLISQCDGHTPSGDGPPG